MTLSKGLGGPRYLQLLIAILGFLLWLCLFSQPRVMGGFTSELLRW